MLPILSSEKMNGVREKQLKNICKLKTETNPENGRIFQPL
jgi:hypothetical protein